MEGGEYIIKKKSIIVMVGVFFATALLFTQSAFAAGHSGDTKPGWGHGDKNHHHVGPPGHSVSVHPGDEDEDGDHDRDDREFHKFFVAWSNFFRHHHWSWHNS